MAGANAGKSSIVPIILLVCALLALPGCGGGPDRKENPFFDKWREKAEQSKGFTPTRSKIQSRDVTAHQGVEQARRAVGAAKDKPLPNRRITVKLRDLEVGMVLRAVARAVNQNIMINAAIAGKVTVDVKNVPWDQVFTGILRTQGLDYAWEGDIIRVMTLEEKLKEEKRDIVTVIIPVEYSDAEGLRENLQAVLTGQSPDLTQPGQDAAPGAQADPDAGAVMVDKQTNSLIIQASREEIQRLIPIIETLDRPTPQILIEAYIVEATKEAARELGVQWGGLLKEGNQFIFPGANSTGALGNTVDVAPAPTSGFVSNPLGLNQPGASISAPGAGLALGYLVGNVGESLLAVQLNALQRDRKLNILSNPSITTLENLKAHIESGADVPFRTVDSDGNPVVEFRKATLSLDVTPQVVEGDVVKLNIDTKKDELDFTRTVDGNPTILTKNAQTNVIVANGETTVIGGLNKETLQDANSGVPGLKDVPVLGWLFKVDTKTNEMEELLIFITPFILKERTGER